MSWNTRIDSEGNEIMVNSKPVYQLSQPKDLEEMIKDLKLKRSYKLIELEEIEKELVRLNSKITVEA